MTRIYNKDMKKLLAAMFVALLMVGCGGDGKSGSNGSESNQSSVGTPPVKSSEVAKIDLKASGTPDDLRPIDDVLKDLDKLIQSIDQSLGTKDGSGNTPQSVATEVDPEAMVRGVAKAFAAKDYEAFRKFTCLGMGKNEFKQFMTKNDDRKVVRTWNPVLDDFEEELIEKMQKAYSEILRETREKGFDWSQAKIAECEKNDDVKATLRSGNVVLYLHLDDCFMTPKGLLAFDAPRAKTRELAATNSADSTIVISLHEAAERGDLVAIVHYFRTGTDINAKDGEDGETPLHRAITRGQTKAAEMLISIGCDLNIGRTKDGDTPLDMAEERGRTEIAKLLREKGAKRNSD